MTSRRGEEGGETGVITRERGENGEERIELIMYRICTLDLHHFVAAGHYSHYSSFLVIY